MKSVESTRDVSARTETQKGKRQKRIERLAKAEKAKKDNNNIDKSKDKGKDEGEFQKIIEEHKKDLKDNQPQDIRKSISPQEAFRREIAQMGATSRTYANLQKVNNKQSVSTKEPKKEETQMQDEK